jgi:hypothetical protein
MQIKTALGEKQGRMNSAIGDVIVAYGCIIGVFRFVVYRQQQIIPDDGYSAPSCASQAMFYVAAGNQLRYLRR